MNEQNYLNEMIWVPGRGPDEALVREMASRFPKPREPLGEAWFMGRSRYLYDDLNAGGIEAVGPQELRAAFHDTLGGLYSFPEMQYWSEWYGYLTTQILMRNRYAEDASLGLHLSIYAGLIGLDLNRAEYPLAAYCLDFAAILSLIPMQAQFWNEGLYQPLRGDGGLFKSHWGNITANGDLAAAKLIVWRYLNPDGIDFWLKSLLAIEDLYWRADFVLWTMSLKPIFQAGVADRKTLKECKIDEIWGEFSRIMTHLAHKPPHDTWSLVAPANIGALQASLRAAFDYATYSSWIEQFAAAPELWPQMELWMEQFQQLFLD